MRGGAARGDGSAARGLSARDTRRREREPDDRTLHIDPRTPMYPGPTTIPARGSSCEVFDGMLKT